MVGFIYELESQKYIKLSFSLNLLGLFNKYISK